MNWPAFFMAAGFFLVAPFVVLGLLEFADWLDDAIGLTASTIVLLAGVGLGMAALIGIAA